MPEQTITQRPWIASCAVSSFFAGILAGTIWVNRTGALLPGELFAGIMTGTSALSELPGLILKRGLLAGMLWLTGMSLLAVPGTLLFLAWLGFSMAFLISCMTIRFGAGGLFFFIASVFPQILFYLPVGVVLSIWGLNGRQRLHLPGFLVLLLGTAAGAAAELLINPILLSMLCSQFLS